MKRAIINQLNQLSDRQQGYVAGMHIRLMSLCVKAEVVSLIPVEVIIDGEVNRLEDVANVGQKEDDEYSLYIFPKYDDDMRAIAQSVAMRHPEFKQEVDSQKVDPGDGSEQDLKFLKVTMPEVDDNRYDALKQATDVFYQKCKADMKAAQTEVSAQIAILGADESPLLMDDVKKNMDQINDMWDQQREKIHEDKLKEIEEGHNKWMAGQTAKQEKEKEQQDANDNSVATSMRMSSEDDKE
jgi:hypothetical protein